MAKGLELPINMIIVIAIAVLVLVVVAAFFAGRVGGGQLEIQREQALADACQKAITLGCNLGTQVTLKYDDPILSTNPTVQEICDIKDFTGADNCKRRCGCP